MGIVICVMVPLVAIVTIVAVVCGYRMGRGEKILKNVGNRKSEAESGREAVIAANIDRYDGTANGQQEVK